MNKEQIIARLEYFQNLFGLDKDSFVINSGTAMVMHGLRDETTDIDIEMDRCTIQALGRPISADCKYRFQGDFDIGLAPGDAAVCRIDGYMVYTLEELLEQKRRLLHESNRAPYKRTRDQSDIDAILKHIAEQDKPHVFEDAVVLTEDAPARDAFLPGWLEAYERPGCNGWRHMVNAKGHISK